MAAEFITVETDTFSEQEARKVFNYLCKYVLQRKRGEVKRKILHIKSRELITWQHVFEVINCHGLEATMGFSYNKNKKATYLTLKEINRLRLKKGMASLPNAVIETLDNLTP